MKIGMAQIRVYPDRFEQNLQTIEAYAQKAADAGCDIAVFPECSDFGWANPQGIERAEPIPGKYSDFVCALAKKHAMHIVCGLTERDADNLYNAAILVDDRGEILLKHRKINLLTGIEDMYAIGDRLGVAETRFGRIGLAICADNLIESVAIGHTLGRMGCQLLLSPSSWAVPEPFLNGERTYDAQEWIRPYSLLSKLYKMPVVGVSNVGDVLYGVWTDRCCIGSSVATDSLGRVAKILPFGRDAETLGILELDLSTNDLHGTSLAESVFRSANESGK